MTRLRRHIALLIRLRQETQKRLEGVRAPRRDASEGEYARLFRDGAPPLSFADTPLVRHLGSLDRDKLPGADTIRQEAASVKRGSWTLFGHPIRLERDRLQWRAHPMTGTIAPLQPWHQLRFLRGEMGGDIKLTWELNRQKPLLRLAQDWFLNQDAGSAALLASWLDGWMEQNPPGWGINWASSLEVAFRAITWCWIAALTHDAPIWSEERRRRFLWFLWKHARHVERYDSVHHSPNTHLTGEALALLYVGGCFPRFRRAHRWRQFGVAILQEEMRHQVLADGMHFERATGYHRYTVEILLHAMAQLRLTGQVPEANALEPIAARVTEVLAALRRPDGSVPVIGDEDGGNAVPLSGAPPRDVAPILLLAAGLLGRPEWIREAPEHARDLAWWLLDPQTFSALPHESPGRPVEGSLSLLASGYFAAWEPAGDQGWFCLVDGGPHGGNLTGHAHDDCAHVEIARGSLPVSVDPGSASYTGGGERREWDRSAAAHATLVLEGRSLSATRGPFGWESLPPDPTAQAAESGTHWACRVTRSLGLGEAAPRHERQTVLQRGYGIIVCDWLSGASGLPIRITWPMLERPENLRLEEGSVRIGQRVSLTWKWSDLSTPEAVLAPHRFAPSYGESRDGSALLLRGSAREQTAVLSMFADATAAAPRVTWSTGSVVVELPDARLRFSPGRLPESTLAAARTHALSGG